MLTGAQIKRVGSVVELRFALKGAAGRARLSTHGSRLLIDLDHTRCALPARPLFGRETQPVDLVRTANVGDGRTRVVIEVSGRADYAMARLPHELLVRVAPVGAVPDLVSPLLAELKHSQSMPPPAAILPAARAAPAPATRLAAISPPRPASSAPSAASAPSHRRPLVVVDPGHGGFDPGTEAGAPLLEKTLALQIAIRLAQALEARGIRVKLTRNGDYFVSLADRTRIANRAGADLFVSIHLNSSPDPNASGITTYYLNNTTDRATIRLARMENAADRRYGARQPSALNYILSDLRQNYKAAASASLARMIEAQAVARLDSAFHINVDDDGAKKGPFYVLVGAKMPAVLVECGFLSNRVEAARLTTPSYQQILAGALADAIVHYFNSDAAVGNP